MRYGVSAWTLASAGGSVVVISAPFRIRRPRRSRSSAANAGSGSTGAEGRRSASSGSGIATLLLLVTASERGLGAGQQRLRAVDGPAQVLGDARDRQAVDVTEGQSGPVVHGERLEHLPRAQGVEPLVPRVAG